jgi:hypothetical protein
LTRRGERAAALRIFTQCRRRGEARQRRIVFPQEEEPMRHIHPFKAGVSVGAVVGLWHLVWAGLVAAGWAKPILDFVLRLHMIRFDFEIAPFALGTAAALVALTFAIGFVFGVVFAAIWNRLAGAEASETTVILAAV